MNLTPQQLRRAASIQEKLASLQKELGRVLGTPARGGAAPGKRRKMSAAARARIAAAQRARWAKAKGVSRLINSGTYNGPVPLFEILGRVDVRPMKYITVGPYYGIRNGTLAFGVALRLHLTK